MTELERPPVDVVLAAFHTGGELAAALDWVGGFVDFTARYDTFPPAEGIGALVRWMRRGEVPPPPPEGRLPSCLVGGTAREAFAALVPLGVADRLWPKAWPVTATGASYPAVIAVRVSGSQVAVMRSVLEEIASAAADGGDPVVARALVSFTGPDERRGAFVDVARWIGAVLELEVDEELVALLERLAGARGSCVLVPLEQAALDRMAEQLTAARTP